MNARGPTRFHRHHGSNIVLDTERLTATRRASFDNAIAFSEKPLAPGEIFLVEIKDEKKLRWEGSIRIGLTQLDPNLEFSIPKYSLPDLASKGSAWIQEIDIKAYIAQRPRQELGASTRGHEEVEVGQNPQGKELTLAPVVSDVNAEAEGSTFVRNAKRFIKAKALLLPTSPDGVRIGVMYVPTSEALATMHVIINGEVQEPIIARNIPCQTAPLFAVVDVYGSTKTARVVQLHYEVETLQSMCRRVILRSTRPAGVSKLPLPKALKDYLLQSN